MSNGSARLLVGGVSLLFCCGLPTLILSLVFGWSRGPEATADRFLALVAEGKTHDAWFDSASALRKRKTPAMLTLDARQMGLEGYASSSWDRVTVENDKAHLEGMVTTWKGAIPLLVELVLEGDQWRVLSVAVRPQTDEGREEDEEASDQ